MPQPDAVSGVMRKVVGQLPFGELVADNLLVNGRAARDAGPQFTFARLHGGEAGFV